MLEDSNSILGGNGDTGAIHMFHDCGKHIFWIWKLDNHFSCCTLLKFGFENRCKELGTEAENEPVEAIPSSLNNYVYIRERSSMTEF